MKVGEANADTAASAEEVDRLNYARYGLMGAEVAVVDRG